MKNEPQHMLNHMLNFWGKSEPHMLIDFMLIKKKHVMGISLINIDPRSKCRWTL